MTDIVKSLLDNPEHAHLTVGPNEFEVVGLDGVEGLSRLFEFDLVCNATVGGAMPDQLVGQPATLMLTNQFGPQRTVVGIISEVVDRVSDDGFAEIEMKLVPEPFRLTLGRDSRVFQHMTVPDIVKKVVTRQKGPTRWELEKTYRERVYTAQYREDDWTFINRLLEEEGIYYWFDEGEEGTVLVFSDTSTDAPNIKGVPLIEFQRDTGLTGHDEYIYELGKECQAQPTKFTVASFNEQNIALKVQGDAGSGHREMYDAPGAGPIDPAHCNEKAKVRVEGAAARRQTVRGKANVMRLVPGTVVTVAGHGLLDGQYLVDEVVHELKQRRHFDGKNDPTQSYGNVFTGLKKAVPYRPPADTPEAKQAGFQSGRVVGPPGEEIHTDSRGRVRVQLHWDREGGWDDRAGKWMRVTQRGVANSMLYPRIGWNVMTFMEEGAVDAPVVLSRVHDAEHMPTYPLPANKTRTVFKTMTSPNDGSFNEITFEDIAGAQFMFLNASKDMNYLVKDSRNDHVVNNETRTIGGDQEWKIGTNKNRKVGADQSWDIGVDEKVRCKAARQKKVKGNETSTITGNLKIKTEAKYNNLVKDKRTVTITGTADEICKGYIALESDVTEMKITGNLTRKSEAQMVEEVSKHNLTITQNLTETTKTDNLLNVNMDCNETITGNLSTSTEKQFLDASDKTTKWTIKSPLTGNAPYLHVEAEDLIELVVGQSTIRIDPTSVTIMTPNYDLSQSSVLIAKSGTIKHN